MNVLFWSMQILLALFFGFNGVTHFNVPPDLPQRMAWMYDMASGLHYFAGTVEILAALGLVLPGLVRIQTRLTPLAAFGLVIVMLGAAAWHIPRNEVSNIIGNLVIAGLAGFLAYGRWRLHPMKDKK